MMYLRNFGIKLKIHTSKSKSEKLHLSDISHECFQMRKILQICWLCVEKQTTGKNCKLQLYNYKIVNCKLYKAKHLLWYHLSLCDRGIFVCSGYFANIIGKHSE